MRANYITAELDRYCASIELQSPLAYNVKYRAFYNDVHIAFQNFCNIYSICKHASVFYSHSFLFRLVYHSSLWTVIYIYIYATADLMNLIFYKRTHLYLRSLIISARSIRMYVPPVLCVSREFNNYGNTSMYMRFVHSEKLIS